MLSPGWPEIVVCKAMQIDSLALDVIILLATKQA
jgi:hypothetical protein